jgi:hypothetical protein
MWSDSVPTVDPSPVQDGDRGLQAQELKRGCLLLGKLSKRRILIIRERCSGGSSSSYLATAQQEQESSQQGYSAIPESGRH